MPRRLLPTRFTSSGLLPAPSPLPRLLLLTRHSSSSSFSVPFSSSSSTSSTPPAQGPSTPTEVVPPPSDPLVVPVPPASQTPPAPPYGDHFSPFKKVDSDRPLSREEVGKFKQDAKDRQKRACQMFIHEDKMPSEIANEMNVKIGTVRGYFLNESRLHPESIYPSFAHNWARAAFENGTFNLKECPTIDDAYRKQDEYETKQSQFKRQRGNQGRR